MYTWTGQTAVYQSRDLRRWSPAGTALTEADLSGGAVPAGREKAPL